MKKALSLVSSAVLVCLLVFPAYAQPAGGGGPMLPSGQVCSSGVPNTHLTPMGAITTWSQSCAEVSGSQIKGTAWSYVTGCPPTWDNINHTASVQLCTSGSTCTIPKLHTAITSNAPAEAEVTSGNSQPRRAKGVHNYCKWNESFCSSGQFFTTETTSPFVGGGS